jgi:hypothetical protein
VNPTDPDYYGPYVDSAPAQGKLMPDIVFVDSCTNWLGPTSMLIFLKSLFKSRS